MNIEPGARDRAATDFQVNTWMHVLSGFVSRNARLWTRLGNLETWLLSDELTSMQVRQPVYITGLARSGTTLILELLNGQRELTAHRYRDYPLLFTPYLWNRYLDLTPAQNSQPRERAHGDGILITPDSPEAFEEVLWMAFFPNLHDPRTPAVLDRSARHPEFEAFYADHIRKLVLVRGGRRYLSKGNYNITRMDYLLSVFEDARFIVPVRDPASHIASLMRQQRRFASGQQENPRALAHLARVGHFEFGLDRRPINTGDAGRTAEIMTLWEQGREVAGWALYWAQIHDFLADRLEMNPVLRKAVMVVRYDELCGSPARVFGDILEHCGLAPDSDALEHAAQRIRPAAAHPPKIFSAAELNTIRQYTAASARRVGLA